MDSPSVLSGDLALELRNITAGYGGVTILRDVSIAVPQGSVVALLGPNGAGKTTAMRVAAGFIRPDSGTVSLSGRDVTGTPAHALVERGLCVIPEGRGIFPSLSVRENLALFSPKGAREQYLEKAASAFPILGERLKQTAGSLSGGEQQMLAVVRAYLFDPKVVLIDEASMGLAPMVVDRLFEFMQELADTGVSLLIVEQYISRALALADRVYLLNQGEIAFSGPADQIEGEEIFERYLGIEVSAG